MAPNQPNTGLFVGLNRGHVVTKKELAPCPSNRKGVRFHCSKFSCSCTLNYVHLRNFFLRIEEGSIMKSWQVTLGVASFSFKPCSISLCFYYFYNLPSCRLDDMLCVIDIF